MKTKSFILLLAVLVVVGWQNIASGQSYRTYNIKNTSNVAANDLHVTVFNADLVVEPVSKARSTAFADPPQGEGTHQLDWPSGTPEVPPGLSDRIAICNEDPDFYLDPESHFTRNGQAIDSEVTYVNNKWSIDQAANASYMLQNPLGQGDLIINSLEIYLDNEGNNFEIFEDEFLFEYPSGRLGYSEGNFVLPEGDSLWFVFPASIPGTYNLAIINFSRMDTPGEVYIQSDGYFAEPNPIPADYFFGNLHIPFGTTSLVPLGDGSLSVQNPQGLAIELGEAEGISMGIDPNTLGGAFMQIEQMTDAGPVSAVIVESQGNESFVTVDFLGIDMQNVTLNAYQGDELVYSTRGVNSFQSMSSWPFRGFYFRWRCIRFLGFSIYYPEWCFLSPNVGPDNYIVDGQAIQADMITLHAETLDELPGKLTTVINTGNTQEFIITDESLRAFDRNHHVEGDLHLEDVNNSLSVGNMANAGQGTLSIELEKQTKEFRLTHEFDTPLNEGASINYTTYGTAGGSANQVLDVTNLSYNNGNLVQTNDFSASGASTYTIRVMNNGAEVYSLSGVANGSAVAINTTATKTIEKYDQVIEKADGTVIKTGCTIITEPAGVTLPDGSTHEGDTVMTEPDDPDEEVEELDEVEVETDDTPDHKVKDEKGVVAKVTKWLIYQGCLKACNLLPSWKKYACKLACWLTYKAAKAVCDTLSASFVDTALGSNGTYQYEEGQMIPLRAGLNDNVNGGLVSDPNDILHFGFYFLTLEEVNNSANPALLEWIPLGEGNYLGNGVYGFDFDPGMAPTNGGYMFKVEIIDLELNVWEDYSIAERRSPGFYAQLVLEGPYDANTGLMGDDLRVQEYLPIVEPYTDLGYVYLGSDRDYGTIEPPLYDTDCPKAVVDWLVTELRSPDDASIILESRPALLLRDGSVTELDGESAVVFEDVLPGEYYIAIRHRNHLPVMTATPVVIDDTYQTYDFTDIGIHYSTDGLTAVGNNFANTVATKHGDLNSDGIIDSADRSAAWTSRNQTGYHIYDSTLDGIVDGEERSGTWNNRNSTFFFP